MASGNKFWPSKQKREKANGVISFEFLERFVEDYLHSVRVLKPSEEITDLTVGKIERGEPISITFTIKGGV